MTAAYTLFYLLFLVAILLLLIAGNVAGFRLKKLVSLSLILFPLLISISFMLGEVAVFKYNFPFIPFCIIYGILIPYLSFKENPLVFSKYFLIFSLASAIIWILSLFFMFLSNINKIFFIDPFAAFIPLSLFLHSVIPSIIKFHKLNRFFIIIFVSATAIYFAYDIGLPWNEIQTLEEEKSESENMPVTGALIGLFLYVSVVISSWYGSKIKMSDKNEKDD